MPKKAFDREMKSESGFSFAMASQPLQTQYDAIKIKSKKKVELHISRLNT